MAILSLFVTSCKKDDDSPSIDPSVVPTGTWKVSKFTDSGKDETLEFSGYTFSFSSNDSTSASKSGVVKSGTWSVSSTKFNLNYGVKSDTNKPLGELTDDWQIISINNNEIRLKDDNDDSGELLTFSR
jgi:hypothetical protein